MAKYRCVLATPTRQLFAGDIDYANICGVGGNYGVLSSHEQFVGLNRPGVVTLSLDENGTEKKSFAIYKGVTQMFNDHLSILARMGAPIDDIDVDEIRPKIDAVKAEIEEIKREYDKADDAQIANREELLGWYETQIKIKEGTLI